MTGHKIAMLRTQANLTQEQLAEKLYVTRELVSKWETGKRNPDYKTIVKLAEIFSVDTDEIINHNEFLFSELSEFLPDISNYKSEKIKELLNAFLGDASRHLALAFPHFLSMQYFLLTFLLKCVILILFTNLTKVRNV